MIELFELIESILYGALFELFDGAISGWHYLFSKSYRKSKHDEWKKKGKSFFVRDFIFGFAGIFLSLVVAFFLFLLVIIIAYNY